MKVADRQLAALIEAMGDVTEARVAAGGGVDFSRYRDDWVGFANDVLHANLWGKQLDIVRGVQANSRFCHFGANGVGKTYVDAVMILAAIYTRGMLVVATSAKEDQLKNQLMRDVARLFHGADALSGELRTLGMQVPGHPERGLLCLSAGERHRLRGYHSPGGVAVWIGEAQGCEAWVFESAAQMAVASGDFVVASGNTDGGPTGPFWKAAQTWPHVGVSALDHPNIIEGRPVIPGGPSRESIAQMAADYGEASPFYVSSVLGQWPTEVSESLFSLDALEQAFALHGKGTHHATMSRRRLTLGVDVARFGGDRTVVCVLQGKVVTAFHPWGGVPTDVTVDKVIAVLGQHGIRPVVASNTTGDIRLYEAGMRQLLGARPGDPLAYQEHARKAMVRVDVIGVGGGVADALRRRRYPVEDFNSSAAPTGDGAERFLNRRAQAYWHLRQELEAGQLALPPEWRDQLVAELMATTYAPGGEDKKKVQVAPKSLIKTRLAGKSPDFADALVMAVATDGALSFDGLGDEWVVAF